MSDHTPAPVDANDPFAWGDGNADPTELNEMIAKRAFRWTNRFTGILGVLALLVAGAAGGAWYQKQYGGAAASSALTSQFAALRAAAQAGGTLPGAVPSSGSAQSTVSSEIVGKVVLVDTKNARLYVTLDDGTSKVIGLADDTQVIKATPAALAQLKTGQLVTVSTSTSGGTTTATTVAMEQR